MISIGQVVYSKKGRDKRKPFIVYRVEGEYVFLIDGSLRKLEKPKKKKIKHIQITNNIDVGLQVKIINKCYLMDSDIRKALESYKL